MAPVKTYPPYIATVFSVLVALEAATYILAALLHVGVRVPLGSATLVEPRIIPAAVAEGLIGVFLAGSSYAVFRRNAWAWWSATGAHIFAVVGVMVGILALTLGAGPRTELNDIYHRVMLGVAIAGLAFLLTPFGKGVLGQRRPGRQDTG